MLLDVLNRVKSLAAEDYAFRAAWHLKNPAEWINEKGRIGDQVVPESWVQTLMTIGGGTIFVEPPDDEYYQLDFEIGSPGKSSSGPPDEWLIVGSSLCGDWLCVHAPPGPQQPEARMGVFSHETLSFDKEWDSVESFWKTIIERHEVGPREKVPRPKPRPPKPHETSEPKAALVKPNGWTQCPHCKFKFYTKCNRIWVEGRHTRCGGRIELQ